MMDPTALSAIIGAVAGGLVLLIDKGIAWYKAKRDANLIQTKQDAEVSLPINEQAVRVYQGIIEGLRQDIQKLSANLDKQDELYLECREEKIALKVQVDAQTKQIEAQTKEIEELRAEGIARQAEIEHLKKRIVEIETLLPKK